MKKLILLIAFALTATFVNANTNANDNALHFNKKYTHCENQWVAITLQNSLNKYAYGFVYIDPTMPGFTFKCEGVFAIDAQGKYVKDNSTNSLEKIKIRLKENVQQIAIIGLLHYKELNIKGQPKWLKSFNNFSDTVAHQIAWGNYYNYANDSQSALPILLKAYNTAPHTPGLEYALAYAYNALNQPAEAVKVLINAIKSNPGDALLYNALGESLVNQGDVKGGIDRFKIALATCDCAGTSLKADIAFNVAKAYQLINDFNEYNQWTANAKTLSAQSTTENMLASVQ